MGHEVAFPVMDEMPDCECCEPAEAWARPNRGFVIVVNVLTGKKVRACGSCLQGGIPLELVLGQPSDGFRPAVGAVGAMERSATVPAKPATTRW